MHKYGDCSFCGGEVKDSKNVPVGFCNQCEEKYLTAKLAREIEHKIKPGEVSEEKPLEIKGLRAEDLAEIEPIDFKEDPLMYQRRLRDEW